MIKKSALVLGSLLLVLFTRQTVWALSVKGRMPKNASKVVLSGADAQAVQGASSTSNIASSTSKKYKLKVSSKKAQMYFVVDNTTVPVLFGIVKGKKLFPVKKAIKKGLCSKSDVFGVSLLKRNIKGKSKALFTIVNSSSGTPVYAYLRKITKVGKLSKKTMRRYVDRSAKVTVNSDCSPTGNAETLGMGSPSSASAIRKLEAVDGDADADGMPDEVDVDKDGDGIINNYDPDFTSPENSFHIFTNLKVGIENTLNTHVLSSVSSSDVDSLLSSTQTMAIEVKGDSSAGETSELDCGTLNYCTSGGTGKKLEDNTDFPGTAGGTNDADGDGLGEIDKGSTGDFQLKTGASASDIGAGDSMEQIVTDSSGAVSKYTAVLQFVFNYTPAISQIVFNEGDATEATFTPTYPVSATGLGTTSNPILVSADSSGNITMKITVHRPQRPGIVGAGEAAIMDIGRSLISVDIPNAPSGGGATPTASGPGGCPVTSYSESDPDLELGTESLVDTVGDYDSTKTDSDGNTTVTFTLDLTACLASASETLDVGESLSIDIAFSSPAGDNAAQKFWIKRSS